MIHVTIIAIYGHRFGTKIMANNITKVPEVILIGNQGEMVDVSDV